MDETSYSDGDVIAAIAANFVPVRVDNDRRPDVNARYNQGGWPTTAFLTPDGALLAGATYLPPDQLRQALEQIAELLTGRTAPQIEQRAAEIRSTPRTYTPAGADELRDDDYTRGHRLRRAAYDEEYAGFGDAPKFPMIDVLEFSSPGARRDGRSDAPTTWLQSRCSPCRTPGCTITPKAAFSAIPPRAIGAYRISRR